MRPLCYVPRDNETESALRKALAHAGIGVHMTAATFLDHSKIWVEEDRFAEAVAILAETSRYARHVVSLRRDRTPKAALNWIAKRDGLFWVCLFAVLVLLFGFALLPLLRALRVY